MVEIDGIIPPDTTVLVTGGGGYVGLRLVKRLAAMNIKRIHIFDLHVCEKEVFNILNENETTDITVFKGDIRDYDIIHEACKDVDLVFHVASLVRYDLLAYDIVSSINVKGTENIVNACIENHVQSLVYISSNTVAFNGRPIRGKSEDQLDVIPTFHRDPYSASKSIAETFVLRSDKKRFETIQRKDDSTEDLINNCECATNELKTLSKSSLLYSNNPFHCDIISLYEDQNNIRKINFENSEKLKMNPKDNHRKCLRTLSLRPGGIYGEGEQKHLPRMFRCTRLGMGGFAVQDTTSKQDMIHVDNLIDVMICSAVQLIRNPCQVGGEAFFVSDNEPINNFEFFHRIYNGIGYNGMKITLPFWIAYIIAFILEIIHWVLGRIIPFEPPLTRFEVYKIGISHYFNIEKAKRLLNWTPKISTSEGLKRIIKFYTDSSTPEKCYYRQDTPNYTLTSLITVSNFLSLLIISLIVMFCGLNSTPFLYTITLIMWERTMGAWEIYCIAYDHKRVDLFYWMWRGFVCGKRETQSLLQFYLENLKK